MKVEVFVCVLLFGQTLSQTGITANENTNFYPEKLKREINTNIDPIPSDGVGEEFNYQKPSAKPSKEYVEFINFLYRKDAVKPEGQKPTVSKTKRETSVDSSSENRIQIDETSSELEFSKPSVKSNEYDDFIVELYRFDKSKKASRKRREINEKIDLESSDAELTYSKPAKNDNEYIEFIKELYRFDKDKKPSKSKRDVSDKLDLNASNDELVFLKPALSDIDYKEFIQYLYRHDKEKIVKRDTNDGVYKDFLSHLYRYDRFKNPNEARGNFQGNAKPPTQQEEFFIPKPRKVDQKYNDFLGNLYKNDNLKTRTRRDVIELSPNYFETEFLDDLDYTY